MTNHVETFVAELERADPAIAGIGAGAAHQQREAFAAARLGGDVVDNGFF